MDDYSSVPRERWLAFDIGCLECGEGSGPIGVFKTKEAAEKAAREAEIKQKADWSGEHYMQVYKILVPWS